MIVAIPEWGTATLVEVVWTVLAVVGALYGIVNHRDARADLEAIPVSPSTLPLVILYQLFRGIALGCAVTLGCFAAIGLWAMTQASSAGENRVHLIQLVTILTLVAGEAVLVYLVRWTRVKRHELNGALDDI